MNAEQLADLLIETAKAVADEQCYGIDLACLAEGLLGLPVGREPDRPYRDLWIQYATRKLAVL